MDAFPHRGVAEKLLIAPALLVAAILLAPGVWRVAAPVMADVWGAVTA